MCPETLQKQAAWLLTYTEPPAYICGIAFGLVAASRPTAQTSAFSGSTEHYPALLVGTPPCAGRKNNSDPLAQGFVLFLLCRNLYQNLKPRHQTYRNRATRHPLLGERDGVR